MKLPVIVLAVLVCAHAHPVLAQYGMISSISSTPGKVELEKAQAAQKTKNKIGGLGGSESYYQIAGEKSPVVFNKKDDIQFEIKAEAGVGGLSMEDMIARSLKLYRLETRKGDRVCILSKVGAMGMGATQTDEVDIEFRKQAGNTYLIIPKKSLKPGQYAFVDMLGADVDDSGKNVSYRAYAFMVE